MSGESNSTLAVTKQVERAKRQTILMRIIEKAQHKGESPSFAELSKRMREDSWIQARWPNYSQSMASNDFKKVMELTREDIRALAIPYWIRQTSILDEVTDGLLGMFRDDNRDDDTRLSAANTLHRYVQTSIKLFGNEPPKEFHVKRASVHGTIDDFKRLKQSARQELQIEEPAEEPTDTEIIDGEFDE